MSKKPIQKMKKLKETNPLLKSLNIEKMNSAQIQEEISKEEKILNNFISHYQYTDAETSDKKITALKNILKQKKIKEINQRHIAEKEHLKIDEFSDLNNLKFYWDKKFEELQAKSHSTLEELKRAQEIEFQNLLMQHNNNYNMKPSPAFNEYQKEEEGLVKLRKFKEAEFIRKKKEEQRKIDMNKYGKIKQDSIKFLVKKLRQKHTNELLYLQNKFQAEFDSLTKEKQKQMECLNKKYSVKNKDLIDQQKRESNFNKNNNYKKRTEQLHTNYGQNFVMGQKEYSPQKHMENVERLYAELQDNKVEGSGIDSSPEKDNKSKNEENDNRIVAENGMFDDKGELNKQQEIVLNEIKVNEDNGN